VRVTRRQLVGDGKTDDAAADDRHPHETIVCLRIELIRT
jgi:hypothetical protein